MMNLLLKLLVASHRTNNEFSKEIQNYEFDYWHDHMEETRIGK